ncbi:MAG: hypothetical protein NC313_10330, partial [Butyrivibrio sp.]|nr:hypothetical protein [Butyrivibrio sp.]
GYEAGKSEGIAVGRSEGIAVGRSEGIAAGRTEGIAVGRTEGIRILIQTCHELGLSKETIIQKCAEKFDIALESAGKYAEEYCI